ncbi:MAG: right-handed parallel beta-helix repeat-containing protein, partial [Acidobacteria bacterium]|nr:right-handed parallel beta-helix repeat-containing protein [Acidobacteriota bacterium]
AYTVQAGDEGKVLSWSVVAYNGAGDADAAAVSPNWPVAGTAPQFTTNPQITYSATTAGSVLTCTDGTTNVAATITRTWGFSDPPYSGSLQPLQTGSTYTTITDDVGSQLWCDVTASNSAGFVTARAIGPTITDAVTPPPPPPPPPPSSSAGPRISTFTPSSPITATSGQVISGLSFTGSGVKITIPQNVTGVLIEDCDISTSGNSCILNQGTDTTIRFCNIHDSPRGILTNTGTGTTIEYCTFDDFSTGTQFEGHAIETDYSIGPTVIRFNEFTGSNYASDVVSHFQTSRVTFTDNVFDVQIDEPSGAAFTIGDGLDQNHPGRDNYVARNVITQSGGVPAGVFGSEGNTIIEYNCFKAGIQAYNYNGNLFLGVTVRKNVINIGASFVPDTSVIAGWATNVDGTNCALMPA